MKLEADSNWWKTLFDAVYLATDARSVCNKDVTRAEVDVILELLPMEPAHRILDLCGGHGRHTLELYSRGFTELVLLDYSRALIDVARKTAAEQGADLPCVQCDAKATGLASGSFRHVLIMGNSLGYHEAREGDGQILEEAYRLLASGGWVLVDVTNRAAVSGNFKPSAWHEAGPDMVVCREREMQGSRLVVREMVLSKHSGLIRDKTYAIRMYDEEELTGLVEETGFECVRTHPASSRSKADLGCMNHRILVTARKPD